MSLRVAGGPVRGRGRGVRGAKIDPVLQAGGLYLLDDRTRYVRPGLAFARAQQVFGLQGDGSLAAYTGAQVPWEAKGVRLDPGWVQRALSTDSFTTAAWTVSETVPTDGAWIAPDGTAYAKVTASATNATHLIRQTITYTAGEVTTITFLLRAAEETVLVVRAGSGATVWGSTTPVFATFDTATGTATAGASGSFATMDRVHGDAWLCSVTAVATTAAGNAQIHLVLRQTAAYLGNGTAGLFIGRFNVTNTAYRVPLSTAVGVAVTVPAFSFTGLNADMSIALGSEYSMGMEFEVIYRVPNQYPPVAQLRVGTTGGSNIASGFFVHPGGSNFAIVRNVSDIYLQASGGNGPTKSVLRVKDAAFRAASNAALAPAGASGVQPPGLTAIQIGRDGTGGVCAAMFLKKLWLVPSVGLIDGQLQSLSTL